MSTEQENNLTLVDGNQPEENVSTDKLSVLKSRIYTFDQSFYAKLLQSTDEKKNAYLAVKNFVLTYKVGKVRRTWKNEKLSVGSIFVGKLAFRTKSLCVYFPLETGDELFEKYNLESIDESKVKDKNATAFLRLNDEKDAETANEVIRTIVARVKNAKRKTDYEPETAEGYAYRTTENLLNASLIKLSIYGKRIAIKPNNEVTETDDDENKFGSLKTNAFRFNRSFSAKVCQLTDDKKEYYTQIINAVEGHVSGRSRITWKHQTLSFPGKRIGKLTVKGKTLCLYVPISKDDTQVETLGLEENQAKNDEFPTFLRITNGKQAEKAVEILEQFFTDAGKNRHKRNYTPLTVADFPYKTCESLLNSGNIKLNINKDRILDGSAELELDENGDLIEKVPETEEVTEEPVEETTEEVAEEVTEEPVEETTEEVTEEVVEDTVEETTEEVAEEVTEEPVEEVTEEVTEEPKVVVPVVTETVAEEPVSEEESDGLTAQQGDVDAFSALKKRIYTFDHSFYAKLLQSTDEKKNAYLAVKNFVLTYKVGKVRRTWKNEKLSVGSIFVGRFAFRTKSLCVYFPLETSDELFEKYNLESIDESKTKDKTAPSFIRLNDETDAEKAIEIIREIVARVKKAKIKTDYEPETAEGYSYRTTENLLNASLIKLSIYGKRIAIKPNNEVTETDDDENKFGSLKTNAFRFNRSFSAKVCQLTDDKKEYYTQIINAVEGHVSGRSRITWKHQTLSFPGKRIGKLTVKGKTLCLYVPISKDDTQVETLGLEENQAKNDEFPTFLRITNGKQAEKAVEILEQFFTDAGKNRHKRNYTPLTVADFPYKTCESLLNSGNIKLNINKDRILEGNAEIELDENGEVIEKEPEPVEETPVEETPAQEPETEEVAEQPVEEPVQEPVQEPVEEEPQIEIPVEPEIVTEDEPEEEITEENKNDDNLKKQIEIDDLSALKNRIYKFDHSFYAKLVQSPDDKKESYLKIRNAIMEYRTGKLRESWRHENLMVGTTFVGKAVFRARAICVFFPVKETDEEFEKYGLLPQKVNPNKKPSRYDTYSYLKISGDKQADKAVALINELVEKVKKAKKKKDFVPVTAKTMPYETTETLLNEDLIKLSVNGHRIVVRRKKKKTGDGFKDLHNRIFHFNRSFKAKIYQLPDDKKEQYLAILNLVMSYKKGRTRVSWKHQTISIPGKRIGALSIKGKTLCLFLPIAQDSEEFVKYGLLPGKKPDAEMPSYIKISNAKHLATALEILEKAFTDANKTKKKPDFVPMTLKDIPYKTTETLLNLELIKLVINNAKIGQEIVELPDKVLDKMEQKTPEEFEKEVEEEEEEDYVDLTTEVVQAIEHQDGKMITRSAKDKVAQINPLQNLTISPQESKDLFNQDPEKDVEFEGGTFEYRKDYFLRAVDESWVTAIEQILPIISKIIKNPQKRLMEDEAVVSASLARKITSRSVRHLLQHVENICEVKDDGEVIPEKLLNVFMDETVKTYENKFLNTLILKLFVFVNKRYEIVKNELKNEVKTSVIVEENFKHPALNSTGKIRIVIEYSEPPKEVIELKNYTFNSDLWRRVEEINKMCTYLLNSPFCIEMGKEYIRPPVMRTNSILKNPDLHQCLLMWQFLEEYDKVGYKMLVHTEVKKPNEQFYNSFCRKLANRYLSFVKAVRENKDGEVVLDDLMSEDLMPEFVDKATEVDKNSFNVPVTGKIAEKQPQAAEKVDKDGLTAYEKTLVESIEVALKADKILQKKREEN